MEAFTNVKKAADIFTVVRKPMLLHCRLVPGMHLKPGRESMECKDRCRPIDYNFNAAAQAAFDMCVMGEGTVQDLLIVRSHYRSALRQLQRDWLEALGWPPEVQRSLEFSLVTVEGSLPDQRWGSAPFEVVEGNGLLRVVSCFAPWTNPEHHRFHVFLLALYQRARTRPKGSGVQNPEPPGTLQQPTVARSGIPVHGRLFTFLWHLHKQLDAIAPTLGDLGDFTVEEALAAGLEERRRTQPASGPQTAASHHVGGADGRVVAMGSQRQQQQQQQGGRPDEQPALWFLPVMQDEALKRFSGRVFVARPDLEDGWRVLESFGDRLKNGEGEVLQADGATSSCRAYSELLYHPDPASRSGEKKDMGPGRLAVHEQVEQETFSSLLRLGLLLRLSADQNEIQYKEGGSKWRDAPAALLAAIKGQAANGEAGLGGVIKLNKADLQTPGWFLDLHKWACAAEADRHGCKNQLTAGGVMAAMQAYHFHVCGGAQDAPSLPMFALDDLLGFELAKQARESVLGSNDQAVAQGLDVLDFVSFINAFGQEGEIKQEAQAFFSGEWLHMKKHVLDEPDRLLSLPDARRSPAPMAPQAFYRLSTSRPALIVLHSHLGPSTHTATPLELHLMYMTVTQEGISFEEDAIKEKMSRYGPRSALGLIRLCEEPHQAQPAGVYEALLAILRELRGSRPDGKYRRRGSSGRKRPSHSLHLSAVEAVGPAPCGGAAVAGAASSN